MHAKQRNDRFQLYRSFYVRKGQKDNSHGYAEQIFVGSLPIDAQSIPPELDGKLTDAERSYVEEKVIEPARQAAEARRQEQEVRERDPNWRVAEAELLLREAGELAAATPGVVDATRVATLMEVVAQWRILAATSATHASLGHPLQEALEAIQRAALAVSDGHYGKAPAENVRTSEPYQLWDAIKCAMNGDTAGSLLRALQDAGYVKTKGK